MKRKALLTAEQYEALSDAEREDYLPFESKELPGHYVLDVEGIGDVRLENVGALKRAHEEQKRKVKQLEVAMQPFKDLDPAAAREAMAKVSEMDSWDKDEKVKEQLERFERQTSERFERDKAAVLKKHQDELDKITGHNKKLDGQLRREMVDSQVNMAIAEFDADPLLAGPVLKPRITVVENDDGDLEVRVLHESNPGEFMLGPGATTSYASVKDLFATARDDGRYARLFNSKAESGTGARNSATSRNGSGGAGLRPADFQSQQAYEARVAQLNAAKQPLAFKQ